MYLCTAFTEQRDVAQLVSVHVWGACGRWFESSHPDLRTKKRSYDIAQQYRNFFLRQVATPNRRSSVPLDNTTQTIHNSEFINFGGASDGSKRMNGGLLSVVERGRSTSYLPAKIIKRVQIDVIHAIRTPSTLHLHLIHIASTPTV